MRNASNLRPIAVAFLVSHEQALFFGDLNRLTPVLALRRKVVHRHVVVLVRGIILKHEMRVYFVSLLLLFLHT